MNTLISRLVVPGEAEINNANLQENPEVWNFQISVFKVIIINNKNNLKLKMWL